MRKSGVVEVVFILHKNGGISELGIAKSSGVAILDEAALKSVQKASQSFEPLGDDYKITIPVAYKLI